MHYLYEVDKTTRTLKRGRQIEEAYEARQIAKERQEMNQCLERKKYGRHIRTPRSRQEELKARSTQLEHRKRELEQTNQLLLENGQEPMQLDQ